jgi:preprotein translocase subunit SecD
LQGGTHVVLEAVETPDAPVNDDALNRVVRIIERRVNELGLTEPLIQRQGAKRVIVELPGIKDPDAAIAMLGKTALLEFKDPSGKTALTGKDLKDSRAQAAPGQGAQVSLEFTSEGGEIFFNLTSLNVGKSIAILLDGQVLTAPVVNEPIRGGKAVITGSRNIQEAEQLAILLRSGALPVKMEVIENRTVGPTLGQDSKDKSAEAFVIGIAGIIVFMLAYYRLSGLVATIALLLYVLLLLLAMKSLQATLTLPGIAGIILGVGMAVDANVLIFERFKEELRAGRTLRSAIDAGFDRAFTTILDSNVTTLFVAGVLFYMGTGPVRGFAVTLALGIVISMFTAITVTKFMLKSLINSGALKNSRIFGA